MTVLNNTPYYNKSIRNITAAFGTLFNNISIVRTDSNNVEVDRFVVPLVYAKQNTWYKRLKSKVNVHDENSQSTVNVGSHLPAMSFAMTSMQYNAARKLNSLNTVAANMTNVNAVSTKQKTFAPAPYDFSFELNVYSKNIDDGLQIIEQIVPFFQPSINIKLKELVTPEVYNDIQVTLESVTPEDEIDWTGGRLVSWNLTFRVTGNIYPPLNTTKVILGNVIDVLDKNNNDNNLATVVVNADNLANIVI